MTTREELEQIPAGTELLRAVRYMHAEDFDTCSTDELVNAGRWLRAASYSAAEGARRIDSIVRNRLNPTEEKESPTCTSGPNITRASTSTEEPPTATPPPPAPRSRSSKRRTAPE